MKILSKSMHSVSLFALMFLTIGNLTASDSAAHNFVIRIRTIRGGVRTIEAPRAGISAGDFKKIIERAYDGQILADQIKKAVYSSTSLKLDDDDWLDTEVLKNMQDLVLFIIVDSAVAASALTPRELLKEKVSERWEVYNTLLANQSGYGSASFDFRVYAAKHIPEYEDLQNKMDYDRAGALIDINKKITYLESL